MFKGLLDSGKKIVKSSKDLVTSTLNKISDPDAIEVYKRVHIYNSSFEEVIKNYELKFEEVNLKDHDIASCELVSVVAHDNIITKKRQLHVNLLNTKMGVPEQIIQYMGDPIFIVNHVIEIDNNTGTALVISKNISHDHTTFYEEINFKSNGDTTKCDLFGSLSVNLFVGINETVKKLWISQYGSYYEKYFSKN
jgi:hypothetical protein